MRDLCDFCGRSNRTVRAVTISLRGFDICRECVAWLAGRFKRNEGYGAAVGTAPPEST